MSGATASGRFDYLVTDTDEGTRLDVLLTRVAKEILEREISRAQTTRWITEGLVSIGGRRSVRPAYRPEAGEQISFEVPEARALNLQPAADVPISVVFEDEHLIVLNKQAGVSVHPGAGRPDGTLVNALLHHLGPGLKRIGDALRPGIVHRLDKDTSGLIVVAKSDTAFRSLRKQLLPPRTMGRRYLALVYALPKPGPGSTVAKDRRSGTIDLPIGRDPRTRVKMAVVKRGGKAALTRWTVRESFTAGHLLDVALETGRTHQIRVHLSHAGAVIAGDSVYGRPPDRLARELKLAVAKFSRQALHAAWLSFVHPVSGEEITFNGDVPEDLTRLIEAFRAKN